MTAPSTDQAVEYESWHNPNLGRVVIIKLDGHGQKRHEIIGANKKFHLTPEERRLNQELCASEEQDIFLNGTLQPIRLIPDHEDTARLLHNPNHVSEDDVRSIFKLKIQQFTARLGAISNETALQRLLEIARDDDIDATIKQVDAINERLAEVVVPLNPKEEGPDPLPGKSSAPPSTIKPVTPR